MGVKKEKSIKTHVEWLAMQIVMQNESLPIQSRIEALNGELTVIGI